MARRKTTESETIPEPTLPDQSDPIWLLEERHPGAVKLQWDFISKLGGTFCVNADATEITWSVPLERQLEASKLVSEWQNGRQ